MKIFHPTRRQAGDTIVEVLVSIAVISLVLAGAYASTNRNTDAMQDTQEHSQALQLVQSQIELLRSKNMPSSSLPGCFDNTGAPQTDTGNNCYFKPDGSSTTSSDPLGYHVTIATTSTSGIYLISAVWQSLLGGNSTVSLFYGPPPLS